MELVVAGPPTRLLADADEPLTSSGGEPDDCIGRPRLVAGGPHQQQGPAPVVIHRRLVTLFDIPPRRRLREPLVVMPQEVV